MAVTGIGGVMYRAKDPEALSAWYKEHLGIDNYKWEQQAGPTAFAAFAQDTDHFGNDKQAFMLNFRVDNLDDMLKDLKSAGVKMPKEPETYDGMGKFAWIEDPEGNRIELWQPEE